MAACALPPGAAVLVRSSGGAVYGLGRTSDDIFALHTGSPELVAPDMDSGSAWTAANRAAERLDVPPALLSVARIVFLSRLTPSGTKC